MKNLIIILFSASILFLFIGTHNQTQELYFTLASYKIFNTDDEAFVTFQGTNVYGDVEFKLYKITDPVSFFASRYTAREPIFLPTEESQKEWAEILAGYPLIRAWDENIQSQNRWFSKVVELKVSQAGVYFIEARYKNKFANSLVIISPYALITKQSKSQLLSYIVDRKSGAPIANAKMYVFQLKDKLAEGNSTKDGLFYTKLPPIFQTEAPIAPDEFMRIPPPYGLSRHLIVMGEKDDSFIIADPYYYQWERHQPFLIYTYTDRPVYRPNQEVYFKGLIRKKENGNLINTPDKIVKITIRDSHGGEVYYDSMYTNQFGTYNGKFIIADNPPLGFYQINTTIEGASSTAIFEVQEYKKPEFEVKVNFDKKQYAKGEVITGTIEAVYYFGSPVINANVEYNIYRTRYFIPWYGTTNYPWLYEQPDVYYKHWYPERQMIASERGTLDKEGKLIFKYKIEQEIDNDYTYTIEAKVTDLSRRTITGSGDVKVTRAQFALSVRPDRYVYRPGDDVRVNINMQDFEGVGVENDYEIMVTRIWWDRFPRIQRGVTYYDYKQGSEKITVISGRTDKSGNDIQKFRLRNTGYFTISVSAKDKIGNSVTESAQIYSAEKKEIWWTDASAGIQIIPDKQSYGIGETMRAFIIMPVPDLSVLITSESENIIDYRVERFDGSAKLIEIPLKNHHSPDFYLGISAFANDNLYQTTKQVAVIPEEKFLNIEIIPDKKTYKPSKRGFFTIKVKDNKGKPVKNAELSLGIVDESIYAIASEKVTDIRQFFYSGRNNFVQTHSSLYFSFYGYAQTDRLSAAESGMGTAAQKTIAPGVSDEKKYVDAVIRKIFRDAMHWSPAIVTDENGIAKVNVKYPDNLTTWRATVRAVTKDTKVGSVTEKIIVRKNLLVRVETPRFLTQRDSTTIATVIHNYLNESKTAKVSLTSKGVKIFGKERIVNVPKNGEVRIDWKLATENAGTAILTAKALTDEESDAVELPLRILPHGVQLAHAQVVDLHSDTEQKSIVVKIPDEADISTAKLTINISPSLASTILTALDDLVGYPYGCVEQTMSRFLPTIVVANVLQDLNAPIAASKKAELPKMVEKGLQRLYALQHQDGGWGWWEHDNTDAFMTSYVIYGLTLARLAGYSTIDENLYKGIERVQNLLISSEKLDPTTEAYAIYVLTFANANRIQIDNSLIEKRLASLDLEKANNYSLSLAALSYSNKGNKKMASFIVNSLEQSVTETGTAAFWAGRSWQYNWQDDNVETTASALKALLAAHGNPELVQKAVQFLLKQKQGNSWMSTKQTAIVIFALVDYLKTSKELDPNYSTSISLNDKQVFKKQLTKQDIFIKEHDIEIANGNLKHGINNVRIEKNGQGKLYTTVRISYYSREENIDPHKSGFSVNREYFKLIREFDGKEYIYKKVPLKGTIKSGEEIMVEIKVSSDGNYEYFMLEDPLPPGAEVVKEEFGYKIFDITGKILQKPIRQWWASREIKDEKAAFFARNISGGTYTFSYIIRAQIPGHYHVMPTAGYLMYYPEVRGNSSELIIKIE